LFPTNCIKRFNRAGNEQVLATQDGRDHINEYVHNITNEGEKDNKTTEAKMNFILFASSILFPWEGLD
jgi:hypothetical protein